MIHYKDVPPWQQSNTVYFYSIFIPVCAKIKKKKTQEGQSECEDYILLNECDTALTITFQSSTASVHI